MELVSYAIFGAGDLLYVAKYGKYNEFVISRHHQGRYVACFITCFIITFFMVLDLVYRTYYLQL